MKELNKKNFDADISVEKKVEEESQLKKVGQMRPQRGHTVFQYNTETGAINKAIFEDIDAHYSGKKVPRRIIAQKECIYISALNLKNAVKKLAKYHGINLKIQ